jgi:hypothetical protein
MAGSIRPRADFDPRLIKWGGPNDPVAETCCYCDAPLPECPLRFFRDDGSGAGFCDECAADIFGMPHVRPDHLSN